MNKNNTNSELTELGDLDVLLGRGSGPCRHSGNIRFRAIVLEVYHDYMEEQKAKAMSFSGSVEAQTSLDRGSRSRLSKKIREKTVQAGCRFLQKVAVPPRSGTAYGDESITSELIAVRDKNNEGRVSYYQPVKEKFIREKIKQALRFVVDQEVGNIGEKSPHSGGQRNPRPPAPAVPAARIAAPTMPEPPTGPGYLVPGSLAIGGGFLHLQPTRPSFNAPASLFLLSAQSQQGRSPAGAAALAIAPPALSLTEICHQVSDEDLVQRLLVLKLMQESRQAEARFRGLMQAVTMQRILANASSVIPLPGAGIWQHQHEPAGNELPTSMDNDTVEGSPFFGNQEQ
jgi:hypothetical protein